MSDTQAEKDRVILTDDGHGDPDAPPSPELESGGLEATAAWRMSESLKTLLAQINALAPSRDKSSDGGIGDAAHASRSSDHNPWVKDGPTGVVTARDFTHSPSTGCDGEAVAEGLRASRDPRIKYIIWNRRICASDVRDGQPAWAWRPYSGKNAHTHHVHLSVRPEKGHYDDARKFDLTSVSHAAPAPATGALLTDTDAETAAIDAATDALLARIPLIEKLTALQDSGEPTLSAEASALLARYEAVRRALAPKTPDGPASGGGTAFADLKAEYERLFAACRIRPEWQGQVDWVVAKLRQHRARYETIAAKTAVPWWVVGAIHALEGSFNFATHLHNGDPLSARTVQVPKGRPTSGQPPFTWEASAIDALTVDGLADQTDWSLPRTLYRLERYNGFGSRRKGIHTPYLWSFSNNYVKGKFVRDGQWDPEAVSKQCGGAVMIRSLVDTGVITV